MPPQAGLEFSHTPSNPLTCPGPKGVFTLISNWLSALGKEARRAKRDHLEDMSASADSLWPSVALCHELLKSVISVP